MQTTFEGYKVNTFERGKEVLKKFKLDIPFGQDGAPGVRSSVMIDFKSRGTPWTIIIDPDGIIRYSSFHIPSAEAIKLIQGTKEQRSKKPADKSDRPQN